MHAVLAVLSLRATGVTATFRRAQFFLVSAKSLTSCRDDVDCVMSAGAGFLVGLRPSYCRRPCLLSWPTSSVG